MELTSTDCVSWACLAEKQITFYSELKLLGCLLLLFLFFVVFVLLCFFNSLCRPGWPRTQKSVCLCLLSARIKGVCHHDQLCLYLLSAEIKGVHHHCLSQHQHYFYNFEANTSTISLLWLCPIHFLNACHITDRGISMSSRPT